MAEKISPSWIFFSNNILIILLMIPKSTSAPWYWSSICSNTTMFANNSQYQANLNTLFRYLSSNATNHNGYHQAISSNGNTTNDTIYGHFLCRGDANINSCQDCVTTATTTDLPRTYCPNRKEAIIWYDNCMVRYSNSSFFSTLDESLSQFFQNPINITGNVTQFMELMKNMMDNDIAVRAAAGGSQKKFATNYVNNTIFQGIYGMGQCTPDLRATDCVNCIVDAVNRFTETQGGRSLMPSCVARYEVYPFFNLSTLPPSLQPSLENNGNVTNLTILNNCDYTVWPAIYTSGGYNVPSGFSLSKGESKIINIQPGWAGEVWGRTLCSLNNETRNFSCQTGDCGNGKVECLGNSVKGQVTEAKFSIGLFDNQDTYSISIKSGYNLPMMVAPQGGSGAKCAIIGCMFKLDTICPLESRVGGETQSIIACENPCYKSQEYCNNNTGGNEQMTTFCQSNGYCDSSRIFGESCPRANIDTFNESNTTFSCERKNNHTSYNIIFCPSSNMTRQFSRPFEPIQDSLPPSLAPSPSGKRKTTNTKEFVAIGVPAAILVLLTSSCTYRFRKKAKKYFSLDVKNAHEDFTTAESLMFELGTLQAATNYFSDDQKLGGGGFGNVYKGTLPNGQEIAVKRLTRFSDQGLEAFKNEVVLIAKLQHKNLVRLLGFCSAREERLLVYEFVPNKSLDYLLFDPRKQGELDWPTRYSIVLGIARGLLYLHEDSRPRIIHRDLKAPNILLEKDMNPKISDFGLARISKIEQAEDAATSIIAGTYGYMAPEYAMHGQYSTKSDAYSFGVLLLEIVSGKKIHSKFPVFGDGDLLTYAWRSWKDEKALEFLDPALKDSYSTDEVLRCIHLGLLCVQENSHERPTMSTIVFMLNTNSNTSTLPKPQCPRSFYRSTTDSSQVTASNQHSLATNTSSLGPTPYSRNQLTLSEMSPR